MKKILILAILLISFSAYSTTTYSDFLENIKTVSLANGDFVQWDGTNWVNVDDLTFTGDLTLEGTITSDQTYATAATIFYFRSALTATSGEHNNLRARAMNQAVGASTSDIRGVYGQATTTASKYGGTGTGVFGNFIGKNLSTTVTGRGGFFEAETEPTPTALTNLYGVYIRTKTDILPATDYYTLMLDHEMRSTGHDLDAFLAMKGTGVWVGDEATYGIDMNGITSLATADWRLHNGALFNNSTADLLTITEATVDIDGASTATSYTSDADITAGDNLQIPNDVDFNARNNADSDYDGIGAYNTSDRWEWKVEQESGNNYWGLNPGTVTTDYIIIDSDSPDGTTHGFNRQIGGYNIITATRDSDGAGDSDTPLVTITGSLTVSDTINTTGGITCFTTATSMNDGGKIDLTAASIGWGHIVAGENAANAYFTFKSDGTVTLEDNANCSTTEDNDTTFNIFDSGTGIGFNNELGSTTTVLIEVHYITP